MIKGPNYVIIATYRILQLHGVKATIRTMYIWDNHGLKKSDLI